MKYYIGVDISKHRLDVDWCGQPMEFVNDQRGIRSLIKRLQVLSAQDKLALVLCEASGGYEKKLARACHENGLLFHVAHANHVKYFVSLKALKLKQIYWMQKQLQHTPLRESQHQIVFYCVKIQQKLKSY